MTAFLIAHAAVIGLPLLGVAIAVASLELVARRRQMEIAAASCAFGLPGIALTFIACLPGTAP